MPNKGAFYLRCSFSFNSSLLFFYFGYRFGGGGGGSDENENENNVDKKQNVMTLNEIQCRMPSLNLPSLMGIHFKTFISTWLLLLNMMFTVFNQINKILSFEKTLLIKDFFDSCL